LDKNTFEKITFEISQIDEALNDTKPLRDLCKVKAPDKIESSAVALLLHSFYNGIENILLVIGKNKEAKLPNSTKWHSELLDNAFIPKDSRTAIFRAEIKETVQDYLSFRHFVRHTYSFRIRWEKMEDKISNIEALWKIIKEDLNIFIENN
jgi:hypothetical protein